MKCLSLWQPWASLVSTGAKRFETRSWATRYRGPLLIHAAKDGPSQIQLIHYLSTWQFVGGLAPLVGKPLDLKSHTWVEIKISDLPFGCIIAVVDLVNCYRTDDMTQSQIGTDRPFGDFSLGRFAWEFKNVRRLDKPTPMKGHRKLWDIPDNVLVQGGNR